jgi:hypothetical protein
MSEIKRSWCRASTTVKLGRFGSFVTVVSPDSTHENGCLPKCFLSIPVDTPLLKRDTVEVLDDSFEFVGIAESFYSDKSVTL